MGRDLARCVGAGIVNDTRARGTHDDQMPPKVSTQRLDGSAEAGYEKCQPAQNIGGDSLRMCVEAWRSLLADPVATHIGTYISGNPTRVGAARSQRAPNISLYAPSLIH